MRQFKPTIKTIGETRFYIRPFPAFTAAKTSSATTAKPLPAAPALAAIAPIAVKYSGDKGSNGGKRTLDTDISDLAPALQGAFSGLSGDKLEYLCRELLVAHGNVSVSPGGDDSDNKLLDEDAVNELFCGGLDEMFMLIFEVIKVNFSGFFKKLAAQFGAAIAKFKDLMAASSASTETSTPPSSES